MAHLSVSLLSSTFYGSFCSEPVRMGGCNILFFDFIPKIFEFYHRMIAQTGIS